MKITVGQIASKENFFQRNREVNNIRRHLQAGANLQIAAARRVGKSSILTYLKDNPEIGVLYVYVEVESARSTTDFYRKVYKEIIQNKDLNERINLIDQLKKKTGFLSKIKSLKFGKFEIELNDLTENDYEEDLINLLIGMDLEGNKLIIMIDEFPEVILNILEDHPDGGASEAKKLLQSNRAIRHNQNLLHRVQFIYTGSNSLNMTVANLDASNLINDLASIRVLPLLEEEIKQFLTQILNAYQMTFQEDMLDYMITKVEWHILFYYQLLVSELLAHSDSNSEIKFAQIDLAVEAITGQHNDQLFDHYVKRLKRVFQPVENELVTKLLNELAQRDQLTKAEIFNLAHGILDDRGIRKVLDVLQFDGYIVGHSNQSDTFKFNSPILKKWWLRHES